MQDYVRAATQSFIQLCSRKATQAGGEKSHIVKKRAELVCTVQQSKHTGGEKYDIVKKKAELVCSRISTKVEKGMT